MKNNLTNLRRINNKAQAQNQIFIYIMVLVIGAGILVFGYKAITGIKDSADNILYAKFENSLSNDIRSISYQGVQTPKYELPSTVEQVCFKGIGANAGSVLEPRYGIIKQAIIDLIRDSVFIYPNGERSFYPGKDIVVNPDGNNFKCIDVKGGILQIRITGQGNSVLIEE